MRRYRVDGGRSCIDLRIKTARHLFDLRDPAPFRERDLDPGAAEHLLTCIQEIPRKRPVRIVISIAGDDGLRIAPLVLKDAIQAHFEHEREVIEAAIRDNFRNGRFFFVVGLGVLALFLTLSKLSVSVLGTGSHIGEIVKEGFVITGWVAMWRPAEVLLYDWWPLYEKRRWVDKLLASDIDVSDAGGVARGAPPLT